MTKISSDKRRLSLGVATAIVLVAATVPGLTDPKQDEGFTQVDAVGIPGNALVSFDISWVDPALKKYYLGDRSNKSVDVIDTATKAVTQFTAAFVGLRKTDSSGNLCPPSVDPSCANNNDVSGPDGVLTLNNSVSSKTELWVGDGDSRVWVMDAKTGAVLALAGGAPNPIPTSTGNHHRADELCSDPVDQLVMVANNADDPPFASLISTKTYTVVKKIPFDGTNGAPQSNNGAEQCGWSPRTGKFYISIPGIAGHPDGEGGVAVIDPKTMKVEKTFIIPVADCAAPQGMAIGPAPQILLGCNAPSPSGHSNTVIINEHNGNVLKTLVDLGGNDEVWFNPGDGHYFLAEGQLLPTEQLGVVDSGGKRADQAVPVASNPGATTRRSHSVAADPNVNQVYLPIPANTTGFSSTLCTDPTKGCVAVFATAHDDKPRFVRHDDHDHDHEGDHDR